MPRTVYLVGELYRRLGEFDVAISWFARVKADKGSGIEGLCRKQSALARAGDAANVRIREEIRLY